MFPDNLVELYQSDNPFAITPPFGGASFTQEEYLMRFLDFCIWQKENPVKHKPFCKNGQYEYLYGCGWCCLPYIRTIMDGKLFNLYGCHIGLGKEKRGSRLWLAQTAQRFFELSFLGLDRAAFWIEYFGNDTRFLAKYELFDTRTSLDLSPKGWLEISNQLRVEINTEKVSKAFGYPKDTIELWLGEIRNGK